MTLLPRPRGSAKHPSRTPLPLLDRRNALIVLALAAGGIATSLYLTYVHYRLSRDPTWQSICAISPTLSCDAVISSPYGTLLGAPISAYAVWFYALIAALALAGRWPQRHIPRSAAVLLAFAGAFALAISLALGFVSAAWIGSLCLACTVLYLVNLGLLLCAWRALRASGESLQQAFSAERIHARRHGTSVAVVLGCAFGLVAAIPWGYSQWSRVPSAVCDLVSDPAFKLPLTVIVYSDYQCPHCRTLDRSLRLLRNRSGFLLIARHYPLDSACNPHVKRSLHPGACLQARAAICAAALGHYDDLSDRLFDGGSADAAGLVEIASALGFDPAGFETCLWSESTAAALDADIRAGVADGVRGTPTKFINGKRHVGSFSADEIACFEHATRDTWGTDGSRR